MGLEVKKVLVTPELAHEYLKMNTANARSLDMRRAGAMAQAMRDGQWKFNHQGIAFDDKGNLVDGQHRLTAIVFSGVSVEMLVTKGISSESSETVDIGVRRTLGVILREECSARVTESAAVFCRLNNILFPCPADIRKVISSSLGEGLIAVDAACSTSARRRSTAGNRMAVAARWTIHKEYRDWILCQWSNFVKSEYEGMCSSIMALTRQIMESARGLQWHEAVIRSYIAFDPTRQNMTKIIVRNKVEATQNMLRDINSHIEYYS